MLPAPTRLERLLAQGPIARSPTLRMRVAPNCAILHYQSGHVVAYRQRNAISLRMRKCLIDLINASPLSKSAIARRTGLSTSTITRIANGTLDPTTSTIEAIALALGHRLPRKLPIMCDTEAVHTARAMLSGEMPNSPWRETLERWAGAKGTPQDLAREAGRAAPLHLRPEVTTIRTN